jgi:hypothetical protein
MKKKKAYLETAHEYLHPNLFLIPSWVSSDAGEVTMDWTIGIRFPSFFSFAPMVPGRP